MAPRSIDKLIRLAEFRLQLANAASGRARSELMAAQDKTKAECDALENCRDEADKLRHNKLREILGRPSTTAQIARVPLAYAITEQDIRNRETAARDAQVREVLARERFKTIQLKQAQDLLRKKKIESLADRLARAEDAQFEFLEEIELER